MIPKTIIHLLSGGMDSVVMLYDLHTQGHRIHCLLFDYGQKHVRELESAKFHAQRLGALYTLITIPPLRGSTLTDGAGGVVVPNRNAILLSIAVNLAVAAKADTVTFACNSDDEQMFPDCRLAFVQAMNSALAAAEIPIEICAPYIDKMKWQIGSIGQQLGVAFGQTYSCYEGSEVLCGKCGACLKRQEALA